MPVARAVLYAATAGVVVLALRSVLLSPPPLAWSVAAFTGYVALVLSGVFVLRWRVFVDAIVRGPKDARGVVLTFDDGPDPLWTPRILDALEANSSKATFFLIGRKAEAHADVVREIVRRGHDVGLHSYEHDRLFALRTERRVRADLERGLLALAAITGKRPALFRPPIGHTNPAIARVAEALDLVVVGWSVSARDGTARATAESVIARVRGAVRDGSIVLLHDASERGTHEPAAAIALPEILRAIDAANLSVVPLSSWIDQADGSST
jgi:peptidoglycan/xylan/chitin deacetylase (PgdA/CDA1 family)